MSPSTAILTGALILTAGFVSATVLMLVHEVQQVSRLKAAAIAVSASFERPAKRIFFSRQQDSKERQELSNDEILVALSNLIDRCESLNDQLLRAAANSEIDSRLVNEATTIIDNVGAILNSFNVARIELLQLPVDAVKFLPAEDLIIRVIRLYDAHEQLNQTADRSRE